MSTPDLAYDVDNQILKGLGDAALQNVEATTVYGAARAASGHLSIIQTCRCVG